MFNLISDMGDRKILISIKIGSKKINIESALICLFVFLGPLGTILTPSICPPATRTYYLILLFFPFFFTGISKKTLNIAALFLPIFLYCLISSLFVETLDLSEEKEFPLIRFFLLSFHFLFLIGALNYLQKHISLSFVEKVIKIYLASYFISLLWGMATYMGFYLNIIPFEVLDRFNILTQFGWGFLRFNPGSYANEYGVVSSFVCSVLILEIYKKIQSKKALLPLIILFILSFIAMVLASTKASLVSLILALFYIGYVNKVFLKIVSSAAGAFFILASCTKIFHLSLFNFLLKGFFYIFCLTDTLLSRITAIKEGFKEFIEQPLLGTGFGSLPFLHNVYLQFLFELGIIGSIIVLFAGLALFIKAKTYDKKWNMDSFKNREEHNFISQVSTIGLIHILSFAITNHNLFHHLTWFTLLLTGSNHLLKLSDHKNLSRSAYKPDLVKN